MSMHLCILAKAKLVGSSKLLGGTTYGYLKIILLFQS